jgi:hypothetical protein
MCLEKKSCSAWWGPTRGSLVPPYTEGWARKQEYSDWGRGHWMYVARICFCPGQRGEGFAGLEYQETLQTKAYLT